MKLSCVAAALVVVLGIGVAAAQPGITAPNVPPPWAYRPPALTDAEQDMLDHGEYSTGAIAGGAFVAIVAGFGSAQALQGRWLSKGWIFTAGEALSIGWMIYEMRHRDRRSDGQDAVFLTPDALPVAFWMVFRTWGVVDAIRWPSHYNDRVRRLEARQYGAYIAPPQSSDSGAVAGLSVGF